MTQSTKCVFPKLPLKVEGNFPPWHARKKRKKKESTEKRNRKNRKTQVFTLSSFFFFSAPSSFSIDKP